MKFGRSRTLQSPKYLQKKRKKLVINTSISAGVVILFMTLSIFVLRLSFFQIGTIDITNAKTIDQESIINLVKDSLKGNYLYVIPKSNFLAYPKREISKNITSHFKKIDSLKMSVKGSTVLSIEITERIPQVIVCDGFRDDTDIQCSYADNNGFVYEEKPVVSTALNYFVYYSNIEIPKEKFIELQKFVSDVKKYGIIPTGLLVSEDGSYELYIKNKNGSTAVIYFDDRTPYEKILSNLAAFWQSVLDKKIGLKSVPNFDYINLRFGNNVFYLLQHDTTNKTQ